MAAKPGTEPTSRSSHALPQCLAVLFALLPALLAPVPGAAQTAVRLERKDAEAVRGYLVDYCNGNYVLRQGSEVSEIPEATVRDVVFLDGRFGDVDPAELKGWILSSHQPVPEAARPRNSDGRRGRWVLTAERPNCDLRGDAPAHPNRQLSFVRGSPPTLRASSGGYDFGHFIDLGPVDEDSAPAPDAAPPLHFDAVRWNGAGIEAPVPVNTYPLLAWWWDARPMGLCETIVPEKNHVYLYRVLDGASDAVYKFHVLSVHTTAIVIDWEALIEYDAPALAARFELESKRRPESWQRLRTRLYARERYRDYTKATINFVLDTRDATHYAKNSWSLELKGPGLPGSSLWFEVALVAEEKSGIADAGDVEFASLRLAEAKKLPLAKRAAAHLNHTYAVHAVTQEGETWTKCRVLELPGDGTAVVEWELFAGGGNEAQADRQRAYYRQQMDAYLRIVEQGKTRRRAPIGERPLRSDGQPADPVVLAGHEGAVRAVAFSPDGSLLASAGDDGYIRLWSLVAAVPPRLLPGHPLPVAALAFSPDGAQLASGGYDGCVHRWKTDTGADLATLGEPGPAVMAVTWSADGKRLISAGREDQVVVWDVDSGAHVDVLTGHPGDVLALAWSRDQRWLAAAGLDGAARFWRVDGFVAGTQLRGPAEGFSSLVFLNSGTQVLTGGLDGFVRQWDTERGREIRRVADRELPVTALVLSRDGHRLYRATTNGTVTCSEPTATTPRWQIHFTHGTAAVNALALSPDGGRLATGGEDGTVRLWLVGK